MANRSHRRPLRPRMGDWQTGGRLATPGRSEPRVAAPQEAHPPPASAHADYGDSADPSGTIDTHLVAGAVAGDRGSQRGIERYALPGDICLSRHNDRVLGVSEVIPHNDRRA